MTVAGLPAGRLGTRWVRTGGALALVGLLAACVSPHRDACRLEVPFVAQSPDRCGTAAVDMVLRFYGSKPDAEALDREIHIPALGGSIPALLVDAARQQGFAADATRSTEEEIQRLLAAGYPLILMLGPTGEAPQGHFVVATGFQARTGALRVHSGSRPNQWWPANTWSPRWERADRWMVWIRPAPTPPLDLGSGLAQDSIKVE
jgi:hypothetical protein